MGELNLKIFRLLILALAFLSLGTWAQGATPAPKKINQPLFLKSSDKVPDQVGSPEVPKKGNDGSPIRVEEAVDAPSVDILVELSNPALFEAIKVAKKEEKKINQAYWHRNGDWEYCHLRDAEGNNWYGWNDGKAFHWVLWRGNRYWWPDSFAGHWLYYARRYWWRADLQTPNSLQVLIKGEYYLCQKDGTVSTDMGQDGNGNLESGPGSFRGDFHHGGHGHGGEGHEGGHGDNGSRSHSNAGENNAAPAGN